MHVASLCRETKASAQKSISTTACGRMLYLHLPPLLQDARPVNFSARSVLSRMHVLFVFVNSIPFPDFLLSISFFLFLSLLPVSSPSCPVSLSPFFSTYISFSPFISDHDNTGLTLYSIFVYALLVSSKALELFILVFFSPFFSNAFLIVKYI